MILPFLILVIVQKVFCEDEKPIEEEKYGVKFASECEGMLNIILIEFLLNLSFSLQFVNTLPLS